MTSPAPFPQTTGREPCTTGDADRFFPEKSGNGRELDRVKAECAACPVKEACLAYALTNRVEGIWAGTSPDERAAMRRKQGIKAAPLSFADLVPSTPATPGHGDWSGLNQHRARNERPCASCRAFASEDARKRRARQAEVSA